MSITALANAQITVKRRTGNIVDAGPLDVTTASIFPDRQPKRGGHVEISTTTNASGSITINGDVGGAPDSETLAFVGSQTRQTVKRFDAGAITSLQRTSWTGTGTYVARSVGADGSRQHIDYTVVSAWPARFDRGRPRWPAAKQGSVHEESTRLYVDWTNVWTPRRGDVITDDSTAEEWLVIGKPALHSGGSLTPGHWELEVRERPGLTA